MLLIYPILIIVFFGVSLESYGLVPPIFNWLTEPLIYTLFVYSLLKKSIFGGDFAFPHSLKIGFLLIIGAASSIANGNIDFHVLFSVRLMLRFYVLYIAVVNLELYEKQAKNILMFLAFLFLIQIPTSIFKLTIYGQGESAIGTYSTNEGSLSTIIPLIAIGYITSWYIYYKRAWSSLFLCLGFVAFSFIGGKRALVFMVPVLGFFIIASIVFTREYKSPMMKVSMTKASILLTVSILLIISLGLAFIPTLNPERKVGGSINFFHAVKFASEYTSNNAGKTGGHLPPTGGRFSTSKRIYNVMTGDGFSCFLLGYGPGAYTESRFSESQTRKFLNNKLNIVYGLTPLGYIQLEYGFLGIATYLSFLISILINTIRSWRIDTDIYWKTYLFGSCCFSFSMILLWGYYHPPSMLGDTIPCVFFLLMAIVHWRHQIAGRKSDVTNE